MWNFEKSPAKPISVWSKDHSKEHARVAALCGVLLGCLQIIRLGLIARKWYELFLKYQKKFLVILCVLVVAVFPILLLAFWNELPLHPVDRALSLIGLLLFSGLFGFLLALILTLFFAEVMLWKDAWNDPWKVWDEAKTWLPFTLLILLFIFDFTY